MRNKLLLFALTLILFTSCSEYSYLYKSNNVRYKYEAAKAYYVNGKYTKATSLLEDILMQLKGTPYADESLYLLGSCYFNRGDYDLASTYFKQYYTSYPHGRLIELARYESGRSLYLNSPEPRLDQTDSYHAIQELHLFMDYFPTSQYKDDAERMIYELQDKLAEKELGAVKLYYNLGTYMGNNYLACVITAENALRNYPYSKLREDFYIYTLRSKYQLALESVEERTQERYRETLDEYYSFKNEFPESKYMKEAEKIQSHALKMIQN